MRTSTRGHPTRRGDNTGALRPQRRRAPTSLRTQGHGVTRHPPGSAPPRPLAQRLRPPPRPRLGKHVRMGTGRRWGLPVSRANPVMLSGTGSRLRYAGSCTFTMRATLSSTILARGVRSSSEPAAQSGRSAAPALRAEAAGGRSESGSARRAGLRARGAEVTCSAPIGSGRVTCAGADAEGVRAAAGSGAAGTGG